MAALPDGVDMPSELPSMVGPWKLPEELVPAVEGCIASQVHAAINFCYDPKDVQQSKSTYKLGALMAKRVSGQTIRDALACTSLRDSEMKSIFDRCTCTRY